MAFSAHSTETLLLGHHPGHEANDKYGASFLLA
jgi:hypothetical protein